MSVDYRSLVVSRHARVALQGDAATADEAWLLLHGHGMLARGMLHWFKGAERPGRLLVAPEALSRFYAEIAHGRRAIGASWVTREDLDNDLDDTYRYLDAAVAQCIPEGLPLIVHGFSQGVSIAARWSVRTTRRITQLVCWAGGFPEDVTADLIERAQVGQPIYLVSGRADKRVLPSQVEGDAARLRAEGLAVVVHRFDGGHRVDDAIVRRMAAGNWEPQPA